MRIFDNKIPIPKLKGFGLKKKPSSFLTKFLFVHLILVLMPIFLVIQFAFDGFIGLIEKEITDSVSNMIGQVSRVVDKEMAEIDEIAVNIALNGNLLPYEVTQNNYRALKTCQEIRRYKAGIGFLHEILFYVRGNPLLYGSSNTFPAERFIDKYYLYQGLKQDEFQDLLENVASPTLLPARTVHMNNTDYRLITYFVPIHSGGEAYATAVFIIDEAAITNIVQEIFGAHAGNTAVFGMDGEPLLTLKKGEYELLQQIYTKLNQEGSSKGALEIDGQEYLITTASGSRGWSYLSYCKTEDIMGPVVGVRYMVGVLVVIILVFEMLVVWFSFSVNYLPIKRIFRKLEFKTENRGANDIQDFDMAIDSLLTDNLHLREYQEETRDTRIQRFVRDLFSGDIQDADQCKALEKKNKMVLSGRYLATVLLCIEGGQRKLQQLAGRIQEAANTLRPHQIQLYPIDTTGVDTIPVLLVFEEQSLLEQAVKTLFQQAADGNMDVTVGVSPVYDDPLDISMSFSQACQVLNYRFIRGKNTILHYKELVTAERKQVWYPKYEMEELVKNVSGGNIEGINRNVRSVIEHIKKDDMDIFAARCLCYDLINTIVKFVSELNIEADEMYAHLNSVISFTEIEVIDELGECLDKFCVKLSRLIVENKCTQAEELVDYVKKHYTDKDFSVRSMSEDVHMSYSYMSKFFRIKTGYTILDYVTMLRFEKVKYMLANTNETIKEVILAAGYVDIPNFCRKFKQREGVSPSQYRENKGKPPSSLLP